MRWKIKSTTHSWSMDYEILKKCLSIDISKKTWWSPVYQKMRKKIQMSEKKRKHLLKKRLAENKPRKIRRLLLLKTKILSSSSRSRKNPKKQKNRKRFNLKGFLNSTTSEALVIISNCKISWQSQRNKKSFKVTKEMRALTCFAFRENGTIVIFRQRCNWFWQWLLLWNKSKIYSQINLLRKSFTLLWIICFVRKAFKVFMFFGKCVHLWINNFEKINNAILLKFW